MGISNQTRKFNHDFTIEMLQGMPREKKKVLNNALNRTNYLTSYYGLSLQNVTVYKEGWYIDFEGCRAGFKMWIGDEDGTFVYGKKKPINSKLNRLHSYDPEIYEADFVEIVKEVWD